MNSSNKRPVIPEAPESFTDEEFASATDRVHATRAAALGKPEIRDLVEAKLADIRTRVDTLAALRKARGLTQIQLSEELGMTQGEISRLERRENLHLTTLSRFIEATGGRLRITAIYNDDEVEVTIGDLTESQVP